MSIEDDDKVEATGSSPEATTDVPTDSSTVDAGAGATDSPAPESTASEPEVPPKAEKTARETLIAKLTGAEQDETDDPDAEQPSNTEAPAAQATAEESADSPDKTGESTEPAKPDVLSEEELVAPVDKHTKPQTRKRIEALIADRKAKVDEIEKMKPLAGYGQSVLKLCRDNNLSAEDFGQWFAFGAAINSDPQKAPLLLLAEAERMAKSLNVQLPKAAPDHAALQDLEDFVVDGITSMELTGDTAKKLLDKIRATKKVAVASPQPPVQTQPPVQQHAPQTQNPPVQQQDPGIAQATHDIDTLSKKFAKDYPTDWPKIRDAVKPEMAKYAGTDARHWARFFEQEVERAKAKFVVPRKTIPQTLRPTASAAKPVPSGKAALLAELTGKGA